MRFLLIVVLFFTPSLFADKFAQNKASQGINQPFVGARALGMGNAYTAAVNDHNSIFYNPAALSRLEDWGLRLFLAPTLDLDILDFIDEFNEKLDDDPTINEVDSLIEKYVGEFYHARVVGPSLIWKKKRWSLAFVPINMQLNLAINGGLGYEIAVDMHVDSTLALAYAGDLDWLGPDHWLSYGFTGKVINRASINERKVSVDLVDSDEDVIDLEKDSKEGMTFDLDFGLLWTPKISSGSVFKYFEPTLALSVKNILDYGYPIQLGLISEDKEIEPLKLGRRIDVGTSFLLPSFWVFTPRFAFDVRDMLHDKWTFNKGYHAGLELYWEMNKYWKGHWSVGVNQGYFTAGFGGKLGWFQLDISTWGEEVGTKSVRREDRRYIAEFSIDI